MKIGIIAGSGHFPLFIAKQNKNAFVLCIENHSNSQNFKNKSMNVSLLNPDMWIEILKSENITHIVFAGKINRPKITNEQLNENAKALISEISILGDNSAVNIIEKFFKKFGFKILPIVSVVNNCFFSKGFHLETNISLKLKDYIKKSTNLGVNLLNVLSKYDFGQSVVVSADLVYAIEGPEGTDSMIDRAGLLSSNNLNFNDYGPVLIKIPKVNQNKAIDLPVIGIETVKKCLKLGFSSIVVSSDGTLIIDYNEVIKYIKQKQFCIYSI